MVVGEEGVLYQLIIIDVIRRVIAERISTSYQTPQRIRGRNRSPRS